MNYRLDKGDIKKRKAFDDIRKSEAEKFKDFFSEMDKKVYGDDKKNNPKDLKTVLLQSADAVRNSKFGSKEYYDALGSFQNVSEKFIDEQGKDEYKRLVPTYPQGREEK